MSIVLYMPERVGTFYSLPEAVAVLYVAPKVADTRVEDVIKRIFAEKEITDDTHASRVFVVDPQSPEVCNGVDCLLHLCHFSDEVFEWDSCVIAHWRHYFSILFDEGDDSFSIVFGDVFGLILQFFLIHFFSLRLRFRSVFIFGNTLKVCDDPCLFIEIVGEVG